MNREMNDMNDEGNQPSPELQRLLSELLDGKLADDQREQLAALLRDNPAAQDAYRRVMAVHALLHLDFGQSQLHLLPPVVRSLPSMLRACPLPPAGSADEPLGRDETVAPDHLTQMALSQHAADRRFKPRAGWRIATAAALAACVMLVIYQLMPTNGATNSAAPQVSESSAMRSGESAGADFITSDVRAVAVLSQATRVAWSDDRVPTDVGAPLPAGKYHLEQGLTQIELLSGASLIVEGPAEFELISPSRIECSLGKIRAHVPTSARGFTIAMPKFAAVDLGTEFTVQVDRAGDSQIQVLDGEVEVRDERPTESVLMQRLTTGQGVRSTPAGNLAEITVASGDFVGREQLLEITQAAHQERFSDWKQQSEQIRKNPAALLYFGFDGHEPWQRVLDNEAAGGAALDGAIVGCQWTDGRWSGKQALEFKRTSDRVRLNVPGEFESLTFAAWVRIEGFERWLSSLMLTDGHQPGEVHWQLTDLGQLMLGVKAEEDASHDFYSPTVLRPEDLGRWVHLACVYNGAKGYVSHYVDGAEVSRENVRIPTKLRIGAAEIGNWVPQDLQDYRIRSLNGRLDEFILLGAPLADDEIREVYEAGKPQS